MEERISCKQIKISDRFYESFEQIYDFGYETFGYFQAERYGQKTIKHLDLIIYRITNERIEVLDIIHSSSSIGKIRDTCKIRL